MNIPASMFALPSIPPAVVDRDYDKLIALRTLCESLNNDDAVELANKALSGDPDALLLCGSVFYLMSGGKS